MTKNRKPYLQLMLLLLAILPLALALGLQSTPEKVAKLSERTHGYDIISGFPGSRKFLKRLRGQRFYNPAFPAKRANNEPGASIITDIVPKPIDKYNETIPESRQRKEMYSHPHKPGHDSFYMHFPRINHGFVSSNRCHSPLITILERLKLPAVKQMEQVIR